jgi:pimeloyl-ACP methyl ester carboxylesterase
MVEVEESDLTLASGVVRVRRTGPPEAPLVVGVHGLSVNLHAFDYLAERLAGPGRAVATFDLRGRGRSPATSPGSYGLGAHARDVLEIADRLGARQFDCVGWSLGAMVAILVADQAGDRVRTLTLLDQVRDLRDEQATQAVRRGLDRLDTVVADPERYVSLVRDAGTARPWSEYFHRMYAYELSEVDGHYTPATSRAACLEDLGHPDIDRVVPAWARLSMPVLVVRALELMGGGLTVPKADVARFLAEVPSARLLELDRNHFGVLTDDRVVAAVGELLERGAQL